MATEYNSEILVGGEIKTQQVKLAADTYYRGMPLEYDAANDRYQYLASGDLAGFWLEDESRAVTVDTWSTMISWGEIQENGIVDDSGDAYTVTEDLIATWRALGFFIKRQ